MLPWSYLAATWCYATWLLSMEEPTFSRAAFSAF